MRRTRSVLGITGLVVLTCLVSTAQASEEDYLAQSSDSWTRSKHRLSGHAWRQLRLTAAAFSLISTVRQRPFSTPSAAVLTANWLPPAHNCVTRLLLPIITGGCGHDAHKILTNERV